MATATHPGTNPQKQKLIQICKDMTCGNNEMNIQQLEKELLASLFNEKCTLGCKEQKQDTNVTNVCIAYLTPDLTVNEEPQAHCSYSYADFPNKDQFNDIMEISSDEDSVQLVGTCAVTNMQLEKKKVNTVYTEANQPKDFSKNLAEQRNEMDVNQIAQDLLSSIFSEEVNQNEKTCHVYWMSNLESSSEVQNTDSGVILANEYKFPLFDPTDMNINNEHDSDELVIDTDYETSDEETVNE
ncbi:hypothetical protein RI129_010158 [Pyrocoelia pectoralis]|uniref:Uncharacterized protein n=1 Tax=Pyrocoelia pectoralis TaxID=417401 RepID=A0AAN7VAR3_9COLE